MAIISCNNKVVLISGITGYIAGRIGYNLLQKGYIVRGTTRRQHSADALLNGAYRDYADRVQILAVPDMARVGAFDEAVKGVHGIIHTASPIDFTRLKSWDDFVGVAVAGVLGILESASKYADPQLESVVLTSSVAAVMDSSKINHTFTEADWNDWAESKCLELGNQAPAGILYSASKAAAEKAFWKFGRDNKVTWTQAAVQPGVVGGPPIELPPTADSLNETLKPIWEIFSGETRMPPGIGSNTYIDVRDVADMHVWCVEHPKESAGQRYMLVSGLAPPQAYADILHKAYPDRTMMTQGTPGAGYASGFTFPKDRSNFSAAKAQKTLGRSFISVEQSVLDTAKVFERYL